MLYVADQTRYFHCIAPILASNTKKSKNIPKKEETAMVEWAKKAFQKLDAILGVKTLVILSGNLQICVRVGPVLDCREQMKP